MNSHSGTLSSVSFGDGESAHILRINCSGESFEVGAQVVYKEKQCTVCAVYMGTLRVKFHAVLDTSMTEANLSGTALGVSAASIAAAFLPRCRALSKLTIGGENTPATLETGMTEGNFSGAGLGAAGAIILAAWIQHKDNGTLFKLDISKNDLGGSAGEGSEAVASILQGSNCIIELNIASNQLSVMGATTKCKVLEQDNQ